MKWQIAQAAEIRWWQHYLRKKDPKEYLDQKRAYWQGFLESLPLSISSSSSILEVGCGPAGLFIQLPDHSIHAVDPLLHQYEQKLAHFQFDWYPNVQFFAQDFESFQAPQTYDFIICLNVINHVRDLHQCLQQMAAAQAPGGQLILSVDAHTAKWRQRIFQLLPGDILHPHQYSRADYRNLLQQHGYAIQFEKILKRGGIFEYVVFRGEKEGEKDEKG